MLRVLVVAVHYPVASGRYITDAFRRLGHDVRHIGASTGNNIWNMQVDARHVWQSDGDLTKHWDDWTPDLVVIAESRWAYHHPVYQDVPHIVWGVDNHVPDIGDYRQPGVVRYFLGHNAVSVMDMSADDVVWLPGCYDHTLFTPSPIPWAERAYDVAMIGVAYPRRQEVVQALHNAGLKVYAGTGALFEDYRDVYWQSRISLCVSAAGDVAWRVFETAAMGCAVLSDPLADMEAITGHNVTTFKDAGDAVKQAKKLLKDGSIEGADWWQAYTWDNRAARVVEWWQETYKPKRRRTSKKSE